MVRFCWQRTTMECAGKRSATPLLCQRESGVALRFAAAIHNFVSSVHLNPCLSALDLKFS
jgi:hypothetical protein